MASHGQRRHWRSWCFLLVWRERNGGGGYLKNSEENARFIAAAETSPDAFTILDSVRNKDGEIVGLRYRYVNYHAEKLLKKPRIELLDRDMCELFPADSTHELFEKYRNVVLSGEPLCEDLVVHLEMARRGGFAAGFINLTMAWRLRSAM